MPAQNQQQYSYPPSPLKFQCRGVNLSTPPSAQPAGKYPLLTNVRSLQDGTLQIRAGLNPYLSAALSRLNVHTLRLLIDSNPAAANPAMLIIGAGDGLYGNAIPQSQPYSPTLLATGFSGNPLARVAAQPPDSPDSWMYIGDSARMVKVRSDGTVQNVGIAPPTSAPYAEILNSNWMVVDELNSTTGWTAGGIAAAPATGNKLNHASTVAFIEYDSADNGLGLGSMATIAPTNSAADYTWLNLYCHVVLGGSQTVAVTEIYPNCDATTVAGVSYDVGTTGLCTVVLTVSVQHADTASAGSIGVSRNSVLLVNGVYYRVLSVTPAPDGSYSVRLNSGGTTLTAGLAAQPVVSFRAQVAPGISAGAAIAATYLQSTLTPTSNFTGTLTKVVALDLSVINGRALSDQDYMHISIAVTSPGAVVGGYVAADVDVATNDFQHNAYYYSFQVSPLQQNASGNLTAFATLELAGLQGGLLQTPLGGVAPGNNLQVGQLGLGDFQWCTLRFRVGDMTRIGTDNTRSLANVAALQISLTVTAAVSLEVVSWGVDGTWLPEVTDGDVNGFAYRYRYRSLATGTKSIPSPATRYQIRPSREEVLLIGTASPDPQTDVLDWERFGGSSGEWNYFATSPNPSASTVAVYDNQSTAGINSNGGNETDVYQPFPVQDLPVAGGTVNCVGSNVVWVSGPVFNINWAPGTLITIAQQTYTVYRIPSPTFLQIVESVTGGVLTAATSSIPSPTLLGQPLAKLWGPMGGSTAQFNFGCGDPRNPGRLYFTKGNNPDAAPDTSFIDITNATEPLINGFLWNNQSYVFTSARLFAIQPNLNGPNLFVPRETSVGRGLLLDWCLAVGPMVWFRAKDGLYETDTGSSASITDADLYPLFPHGEVPAQPVTVRGVVFYPPDDTEPGLQRLTYHNGFLIYDYPEQSTGRQRTLFYRVADGSWWPDYYADGTQFNCHYSVEGDDTDVLVGGTNTGTVNRHQGSTDNGAPIVPRVVTPCFNQGNNRGTSQYGDVALNFQPTAPGPPTPPTGLTVTATVCFDDLLSTIGPITVSLAPLTISEGYELPIIDFNEGAGQYARNVALDLTWSSVGIELWEWIPSWLLKPELTILRATDWDDMGYPGAKFVQGFKLRAHTFNETVPLVVQYYDENLIVQQFTIPIVHPDEVIVPYTFAPRIMHLARLGQSGDTAWLNMGIVDWIFEPQPELAMNWITQPTSHDINNWHHIRDGYLPLMSTTPVTLNIIDDTGNPLGGGIVIPASGGTLIMLKAYWVPVANKSRTYQYSATSSAGFRVFQRDLVVNVKPWGTGEGYQAVRPFGDVSRISGARI